MAENCGFRLPAPGFRTGDSPTGSRQLAAGSLTTDTCTSR